MDVAYAGAVRDSKDGADIEGAADVVQQQMEMRRMGWRLSWRRSKVILHAILAVVHMIKRRAADGTVMRSCIIGQRREAHAAVVVGADADMV